MTTQSLRHLFRFINLFVVAGAFFLINETRLTQVVMGMGFLFLAGVEGGLFLWDAGSQIRDGNLRQWLIHGTDRQGESGRGFAFILIVWTTLGLSLIA